MAKPASHKNPHSPRIVSIEKLMEEGDVATARRHLHEVVSAPVDSEEKALAEALLARTRLPRLAYILIALTAVLIASLVTLAAIRY